MSIGPSHRRVKRRPAPVREGSASTSAFHTPAPA